MLYKLLIIFGLLLWSCAAYGQQKPEDLVPLLWEEQPPISSTGVSRQDSRPVRVARFQRVKPKLRTSVKRFNKRVPKVSRAKRFNKRVPQVRRAPQFNKRVPEVRDVGEHGKNSIRYKRPPQRNPKFVTYPLDQ